MKCRIIRDHEHFFYVQKNYFFFWITVEFTLDYDKALFVMKNLKETGKSYEVICD